MCYLTNSGSEANDLALRLAAAFSKSQDVLVMEDGYHGNIGSLVEVSPKMYKKKNMKKKDHVHISHLPDMFRGKYRYFDEEAGLKYARDLENKIRQAEAKGRRIGAMLCETMFVIPGVHLPPPSFYENVFRYLHFLFSPSSNVKENSHLIYSVFMMFENICSLFILTSLKILF